jgi:predicted ATPase/class 3 adenylate cyclase
VERELPSGTVTFLFSDVEGSTKLLRALGTEEYIRVINDHRRVVRDAFGPRGGIEVGTEGDSFFVAFLTAEGAVDSAREMTAALAQGPIRIRIGVHTGEARLTDEGYFGIDIHLAARVAAAGHGGQVLISGATAAAVGTDGLRNLGEHRLKDFDQPVTIYQLGDERFAPLKTISNTNLPRPASSFVGREREVRDIAALLENGARLVTLTGPGGTGKTRLAIEAAATVLREFSAGVFWVDLSALRDAALVTDAISSVLGALGDIAEHIGEREMLLAVDNLEQVIDAAPALATLVEACPNLRLLVTSRERLRVRGEVEYPVPPLADADAVLLFCRRAQIEPDDAVRQLCRALDNLPLALELAAARAAVLSPAQILQRLSSRLDLLRGGRDADPRQRTLRATIEWSHDLLTPTDQELFARLAAFRGGWTLDAAEEVAGATIDGLESLVDKSLVRHADDRFWMLETIGDYASEQLQASGGADEIPRRHARFFLARAEDALPTLRNEELGGGRASRERHERDLDNFRAALDHLEADADPELAVRMAAALAPLWASGHIQEGRDRIERALRLDGTPTIARAWALDAAAEFALMVGDVATVQARAREGIALFSELGDTWGLADTTMSLGVGVGESGDWAAALPILERSVDAFREAGDERRVMWGIRTLAWAHAELGELQEARALYEDALRRARAAGNRLFEAVVLGSLSWLATVEGRSDDCAALTRESLVIKRDLGDRNDIAIGLGHAAEALAAMGRGDHAARILGAYEALVEDLGGIEPWVVRMRDATLARVEASLDAASVAAAMDDGRKLPMDRAVNFALQALAPADLASSVQTIDPGAKDASTQPRSSLGDGRRRTPRIAP